MVELLAEHIREELETHLYCTVFESAAELLWPRNQPKAADRVAQIDAFAKTHGWLATITYPGHGVTFRKLPSWNAGR